MLMENTYGNENTDIRKHFAYIKRRFGRNGIGILFFIFFISLPSPLPGGEPQPATRQVSQEVIDFAVPSTLPPRSMNFIAFYLLYLEFY
jgi:hypothetical protein